MTDKVCMRWVRKVEMWSSEGMLGCCVSTGKFPGTLEVLVSFRNGHAFRVMEGNVYGGKAGSVS